MIRIFLFLLTNLAVVFVLSIALRLLGVERILDEQGTGLDLNALLVFAGVFGFGGALISLAISKWTAKRLTGSARVAIARQRRCAQGQIGHGTDGDLRDSSAQDLHQCRAHTRKGNHVAGDHSHDVRIFGPRDGVHRQDHDQYGVDDEKALNATRVLFL